jgi:hypothetical protein
MAQQNYGNHRQRTPAFLTVLGALTAYIIWEGYRLGQTMAGDHAFGLLLGVTLVIGMLNVRQQVLTVQDRVIRLEMRLRLRDRLPDDLAARAAALPIRQLVALRFAGDEELGQLVADVLAGSISDPVAIKKRVTDWQADHLRA